MDDNSKQLSNYLGPSKSHRGLKIHEINDDGTEAEEEIFNIHVYESGCKYLWL